MQDLIEKVYLPLYPNVDKITTRDENGEFVAGPVIFKTDSGQGRLSATWESIHFRERMAAKGVYLVLGLPNSTSCTQEQDQIYQDFKRMTRARTNELFQRKLNKRSELIQRLKLEVDFADSDKKIELLKQLFVAMKQPKLTNDDLPEIVSEAFYCCFTKEKIMNCFSRVGYVPFTRKALQNPNIRHELHEDNQNEKSLEMEQIVSDYNATKEELKRMGFRVDGIFEAEIDSAPVIQRSQEEKEQIHALVSKKKAFSASGIYTNIGTMCVTSGAVLKAQRSQMEKYARELSEKARKRRIADRKKLGHALDAKKKQLKGERLRIQEMKGALNYCLKASESNEVMSSFKTKQQVEERLSQFEQPWWSYIPDSVPKQQLNPGEDSSNSVQSGEGDVINHVGREVRSLEEVEEVEEVVCSEVLDV